MELREAFSELLEAGWRLLAGKRLVAAYDAKAVKRGN